MCVCVCGRVYVPAFVRICPCVCVWVSGTQGLRGCLRVRLCMHVRLRKFSTVSITALRLTRLTGQQFVSIYVYRYCTYLVNYILSLLQRIISESLPKMRLKVCDDCSRSNQPEVDLSCRFLLDIFFRFCKEQREFT